MLTDTIREYLDAGFSGLWIQTTEPDEAIADIKTLAAKDSYEIAGLDANTGKLNTEPTPDFDPYAAVTAFDGLETSCRTLLLLPNFHNYTGDASVKQALFRAVQNGKKALRHVLIISPIVSVPPELEKIFVVVEHELPTREQLEKIACGIATEPGDMPQGADLKRLLDASSGLTRYEAEGAYSLSIVRYGRIDPQAVWELKAGALKKNGTLTLHRGKENFSDLGGLENLKDFSRRITRPDKPFNSKGIMLLSPPGCGKSLYCKALGNEIGRPTITMDIGSLMGSLVGQSEERTRAAFAVIDAMAPCVLMLDEIEKGLAGTGTESSGVTTRLFGTFLTWLNDHQSDVFVVCTSNDISKLPPEFTRAERFDGIFFLDLPNSEQRESIWTIHQAKYGISGAQPRPDAENWTGAEIQSCCRLAALMDVPLVESARNVVPVSVTAADRIESLRQWASGRVLDADRPGTYQRNRTPQPETRRAISRGR